MDNQEVLTQNPKLAGPVSIIIPTLNEADFIGYLLFSLSRQTYKNFEVIVSDGQSFDQTKEVVASFQNQVPNLRYVSFTRRSPSVQRNQGAKMANYEQLLFLDADVILPSDFLERTLKEIHLRQLDVAHPLGFPVTKRIWDHYFYSAVNQGLGLLERIYPLAGGWAIFITHTLHHKLNGFDEKITVFGEDIDYIIRARKLGAKFGVLKSSSGFISARRQAKSGSATATKNFILGGIYLLLFGKYKSQKLFSYPYTFSFKSEPKPKDSASTRRLKNILYKELVVPSQLKKTVSYLKKILAELENY